MKRVVITPNPYRDRGFRYVREAISVLQGAGIETSVCLAFNVDKNCQMPRDIPLGNLETELKTADALICFGGDGTILHASKAAGAFGLPILGVNIGTVGFMAELENNEIPLLANLAKDDYVLDERMMLSCQLVREDRVVYESLALNDVFITKGTVARVIQTSVCCDGVQVLNFSGDGLVVATPTGSTAYSLSAGGAVAEPSAQGILLTPVCAHDMRANCFVLNAQRQLEITVSRITHRNAILSVDGGKSQRVFTADRILVRQAKETAKLIRLKNITFFDIFNSKLNR